MQVDIRDTDFVWCSGKILRTVNKYHEKKVKGLPGPWPPP